MSGDVTKAAELLRGVCHARRLKADPSLAYEMVGELGLVLAAVSSLVRQIDEVTTCATRSDDDDTTHHKMVAMIAVNVAIYRLDNEASGAAASLHQAHEHLSHLIWDEEEAS